MTDRDDNQLNPENMESLQSEVDMFLAKAAASQPHEPADVLRRVLGLPELTPEQVADVEMQEAAVEVVWTDIVSALETNDLPLRIDTEENASDSLETIYGLLGQVREEIDLALARAEVADASGVDRPEGASAADIVEKIEQYDDLMLRMLCIDYSRKIAELIIGIDDLTTPEEVLALIWEDVNNPNWLSQRERSLLTEQFSDYTRCYGIEVDPELLEQQKAMISEDAANRNALGKANEKQLHKINSTLIDILGPGAIHHDDWLPVVRKFKRYFSINAQMQMDAEDGIFAEEIKGLGDEIKANDKDALRVSLSRIGATEQQIEEIFKILLEGGNS